MDTSPRPSQANRISDQSAVPFSTDITRDGYHWKAVDPEDGMTVATSRGDRALSGRQLDMGLWRAYRIGRFAPSDTIIVKDGMIIVDQFTFNDRWDDHC